MPSAVARLSAAMLALLSGAALWAMFCRAANVVQVVAAKPGQIESSIDLPHQMIFRYRVRQDETRRTVDLGHSSDGPSWIDLAEIRVNTTESRFVTCLNRLLQNPPEAAISLMAVFRHHQV